MPEPIAGFEFTGAGETVWVPPALAPGFTAGCEGRETGAAGGVEGRAAGIAGRIEGLETGAGA